MSEPSAEPRVRNTRLGLILVGVGAALFVINAGVSRVIQAAGVDSMTLTSTRCTGTAIALLAIVAIRGERLTLPRTGREIATVVGFGITGVALVQYLYFVAIDRLPVGIALLLEFTAPVLVALFARFVYRETVRWTMWLGLTFALIGLGMVAEVWDGLTLDGLGVLAALGAAVSLAAYFLLGEHSVSEETPLHVLTKAFIAAAVFWNLLAPVTGLWSSGLGGAQSLGGALASIEVTLWILVIWLVMLGTVAPFLAELTALRHLSATEVVVVGMLEPVGAALIGWLWFREDLGAVQLAGMALVLAGIVLSQTARLSSAAHVPSEPIPIAPPERGDGTARGTIDT